MSRAMDRDRSYRGQVAIQVACDLHVHSRVLRLSGVQVGNRLPVPGRADRAVCQGRSVAADDLGRVWNVRAENFRDGRPQEVPAAADGRLAAAEYPARESLG